MQVIRQLNQKKSNIRLAEGKQSFTATCPKGKLEFKCFSSPAEDAWKRKIFLYKYVGSF